MASRGSTAAGAAGAATPGAGAGAARGASFTRIVALASWLPAEAMTSVDPAPTDGDVAGFGVGVAATGAVGAAEGGAAPWFAAPRCHGRSSSAAVPKPTTTIAAAIQIGVRFGVAGATRRVASARASVI